ncbi:MAG: VWA domain-containing protein [Propionicimonas sp.]|uniref:VWA domain-containing protein n=1 Tax=Propionicimonas sp. TaxID=1955623 RepID=UPI002B213737|nr:VWA domain-containing protein [Propionicimonas sp.]MEA4944623.1 VWA domain-containing protein [Propionicimonas sp.]MEA5117901.1 VWA domain-containing protein [Propionicimonas sp.]
MFGLDFLNPERLWVLVLVPLMIAAYVWAVRRKKKTGMRFTNTTILSRVVPKQSQWRRHLAVALSVAALVSLSFAWARPNGVEMVPRERATVVLVIDISNSMLATDVKPNRLDAAKQAAITFVKSLPEKYNLALVSLSGSPSVRLPPTLDRVMAQQAINSLKVQDTTAVGEGIYTALTALQMAPKGDDGSIAPGAIVLLSDGQNTAGRSPQQAANEAAKAKVPIYTIAYGTQNGYVDLDGKREPVPPDTDLLRTLASMTGGASYSAESLDQLDRVYTNIRSEVGYMPVKKEITALWAGYGLAFAVVAALAAVSLGARWP